jgi:hypothetical protein
MKVVAIHGAVVPEADAPNAALIQSLEDLLAFAKAGRLQSFIGAGYGDGGASRFTTWADHHENTYEMLGSLAWLQHEYVERHTRPA